MHHRRVSRRCSFFDLGSADSRESSSDRVEVLLKIVPDEMTEEEVEAIRHRISLGDIVQVRCRVEKMEPHVSEEPHELPQLLLHARDITTIAAWKHSHAGVTFVPIATVHKKQPSSSEKPVNAKVHCKFWINTGSCHQGDHCESYHAPPEEMKAARAQWVEQRRRDKHERATQDADPHDAHGKMNKLQRASVFVEWLVETFGLEYLKSGSGVVDVAGGRGNVSFELWNKRQIASTLVDPRPLKLSRDQHKIFKKQRKTGESVIEESLVPQIRALFNTTTFFHDAHNATLVRDASCLVGMHPDEATDPIFDVAIAHNKPFAVVPCCVFGHSFPDRRLPDGVTKVVSYENLIEYLSAKSLNVKEAYLPFDGKNLVLYRLPAKPAQ